MQKLACEIKLLEKLEKNISMMISGIIPSAFLGPVNGKIHNLKLNFLNSIFKIVKLRWQKNSDFKVLNVAM